MTRSPVSDAARRINDALEGARHPAITCSFQPGGIAVLHLMGNRRREVAVLFVDTGYHFQETLEFKDHIAEIWGLDVRVLRAPQTPQMQQEYVGPLYRTNPDQCCEDRKNEPLFRALERHDLWLTALRRDQTENRKTTRIYERRLLPNGTVITKVNPIADWTASELAAYVAMHNIPMHPLLGEGYASIGCAPCTARAANGSRSGRWEGRKAECGLHTNLETVETNA